jgi:adenosylcobinamide-phosphate synthase
LKFLSLIAALLLEQMRPLPAHNPVHAAFERYAVWIERQSNAGQYFHGVLAWALAAGSVTLLTVVLYHLLDSVSALLAWAWNVAVLYVAMGFRRFSVHFGGILHALREGDLQGARGELGRWRERAADELTGPEVARVSIECALVGAHRHLFGPIAWFLVLGPAGAVLYRASALLAERWGERRHAEFGDFGAFAARAFYWVDWVPARLTAVSFAIVGNFEDAIYCWRTQALAWATRAHGIILASGGGALGVRLGESLHQDGSLELRPELGLGDEADVDYMQSATGLIWRALVLWVFLVFILTVARSLG